MLADKYDRLSGCHVTVGLFLDSTIAVARKELAWETDYQREAQCSMRFK